VYSGNLLLDALPEPERTRLIAETTEVPISVRRTLIKADSPVHQVFFPLSGMISLVALMQDGGSVEVATVGNEGVAGVPEALDPDARTTAEATGQVPGKALALDVETFRRHMSSNGGLARLVHAYLPALFALVAQNSSCNRLHHSVPRLARWLLITRDRVGSEKFELTHEFMAQMLGARRSTVSEAAQELQESGLISYVRGQITILDPERLRAEACECYELISARFAHLYY
jgi:CRP-like cAMP-binding protein